MLSELPKPLPWIPLDPFKFLCIHSIQLYPESLGEIEWDISIWNSTGLRMSHNVNLTSGLPYLFRLSDDVSNLRSLIRIINSKNGIVLGTASILLTLSGSTDLRDDLSIQLSNNRDAFIQRDVLSIDMVTIGKISCTVVYLSSLSSMDGSNTLYSTSMDFNKYANELHINIPQIAPVPRNINESSINYTQMQSNVISNKEKFYVEVDDMQLSQELLDLYGCNQSTSLHVTAKWVNKAQNILVVLQQNGNTSIRSPIRSNVGGDTSKAQGAVVTGTFSPARLKRFQSGISSSAELENLPLYSDSAVKPSYLGYIYGQSGHWHNVCELPVYKCYNNEDSNDCIEIIEITVWAMVNSCHSKKQKSDSGAKNTNVTEGLGMQQQAFSPLRKYLQQQSQSQSGMKTGAEYDSNSDIKDILSNNSISNSGNIVQWKLICLCKGYLSSKQLIDSIIPRKLKQNKAPVQQLEQTQQIKQALFSTAGNAEADEDVDDLSKLDKTLSSSQAAAEFSTELQCGLYEVVLESVSTANKQQKSKTDVLGKILIKCFVPPMPSSAHTGSNTKLSNSVNSDCQYNLEMVMLGRNSNLDFVCKSKDHTADGLYTNTTIPATLAVSKNIDVSRDKSVDIDNRSVFGSTAFRQQQLNRNYLLHVLFQMRQPLPNWFQLTNIQLLLYYDKIHGQNLLNSASKSSYFSTIQKDSEIVDQLYDMLSTTELIQCLTICGGRILDWSDTLINDYVNKKLAYLLNDESDWYNLRILDVKHSQQAEQHLQKQANPEVAVDEEHGSSDMQAIISQDKLLQSIIRRCIVGLSKDTLANFDAYCNILAGFKNQHIALTALWSYFQCWLQSDFAVQLTNLSHNFNHERLQSCNNNNQLNTSKSNYSAEVDYLLGDDVYILWTDAFCACYALRIISLHEDIYRDSTSSAADSAATLSAFSVACNEMANELVDTLLIVGIEIMEAIGSNASNNKWIDGHTKLTLTSPIMIQILRSISILTELVFNFSDCSSDSSGNDSSKLHTAHPTEKSLCLLGKFVEQLIVGARVLGKECLSYCTALLSMLVRIQLLHSTVDQLCVTSDGNVDISNYSPIALSDAVLVQKGYATIHPTLLMCITAVAECFRTWSVSNEVNFVHNDVANHSDIDETISLELKGMAELVNTSVMLQLQHARYHSTVMDVLPVPLPPPVARKVSRNNITTNIPVRSTSKNSTIGITTADVCNIAENVGIDVIPIKGTAVVVMVEYLSDYFNALMELSDASFLISEYCNSRQDTALHKLLKDVRSCSGELQALSNENSSIRALLKKLSLFRYLETPNTSNIMKIMNANIVSHFQGMGIETISNRSIDDRQISTIMHNKSFNQMLCEVISNSTDVDGHCLLSFLDKQIECLRRLVNVKLMTPRNIYQRLCNCLVERHQAASLSISGNLDVIIDCILLCSAYSGLLFAYMESFDQRLQYLCMYHGGELPSQQSAPYHYQNYDNHANTAAEWDDKTIQLIQKIYINLFGTALDMLTSYVVGMITILPKVIEFSFTIGHADAVPNDIIIKSISECWTHLIQSVMRYLVDRLYNAIRYIRVYTSDINSGYFEKAYKTEATQNDGNDVIYQIIMPLYIQNCKNIIEWIVTLAYSIPIAEYSSNNNASNVHDDGITQNAFQYIRQSLLRLAFYVHFVFACHFVYPPTNQISVSEDKSLFDSCISGVHCDSNIINNINMLIQCSMYSSEIASNAEAAYTTTEFPTIERFLEAESGKQTGYKSWTYDYGSGNLHYYSPLLTFQQSRQLPNSDSRAANTLSILVHAIDDLMNQVCSENNPDYYVNIEYLIVLKERIRKSILLTRLYVYSCYKLTACVCNNSNNNMKSMTPFSPKPASNQLIVTANPMEQMFLRVTSLAAAQGMFSKLWWLLPANAAITAVSNYSNNQLEVYESNTVTYRSIIFILLELFHSGSNMSTLRNIAKRNDPNNLDIKGNTMLDWMGGTWLGYLTIAKLQLYNEYVLDKLMLEKWWLQQDMQADNISIESTALTISSVVTCLMSFYVNNKSTLGVDIVEVPPQGNALPNTLSSPVKKFLFSPVNSTTSKLLHSPSTGSPTVNSPLQQTQSLADALRVLNTSNSNSTSNNNIKNILLKLESELYEYLSTLFKELEKLHQLLRDSCNYLLKSGEWEIAHCLLKELRRKYINLSISSMIFPNIANEGGDSNDTNRYITSILSQSNVIKQFKRSWKLRKEAMTAEIDRIIEKFQENLKHDGTYRPLPLVYAIRFICSPWELQLDSSCNNNTDKFNFKTFHEATNFEVVMIDSEGNRFNSNNANASVDQAIDLQHFDMISSKHRRSSAETWLLLKYDVLSHVYSSKVYEQMIKLQMEINKDLKLKRQSTVKDVLGNLFAKSNSSKNVLSDVVESASNKSNWAPITLPNNTYFILVEEMRKAFPKFRIHSSKYLVHDRFVVACPLIQIFPAFPVMLPIHSMDDTDYATIVNACINGLGCDSVLSSYDAVHGNYSNLSSNFVNGSSNQLEHEGNRDAEVQSNLEGDNVEVDNSNDANATNVVPFSNIASNAKPASMLLQRASMKFNTVKLDGGSDIGDHIPSVGAFANDSTTELDVSTWEMIVHCTDFFVYAYVDPHLAEHNKINSEDEHTFEGGKSKSPLRVDAYSENTSVIRIKLSIKPLHYTETVEHQANMAVNQTDNYMQSNTVFNHILLRTNYWFSPSAVAFVQETKLLSVVTAAGEIISYVRLIAAHLKYCLDRIHSLASTAIINEPLHEITSSRSVICSAISHLANIIGYPTINCIGLHNSTAIVASEFDRKTTSWQQMRKELKRKYNRELAEYERTHGHRSEDQDDNLMQKTLINDDNNVDRYNDRNRVVVANKRASTVSLDASASEEYEDGHYNEEAEDNMPIEPDYTALERACFGNLTDKLIVLESLNVETNHLIDQTLQLLRLSCINISNSKTNDGENERSKITVMSTNYNEETELWLQLILWLESQYYAHETGLAL